MIWSFIIAIVVSISAYLVSKDFAKRRRSEELAPNILNLPKKHILKTAHIANDLFPLMGKLDLQDCSIDIVGGDAEYVVLDNGEKLIGGFEDWMKRGASIRYFLTCPSEKAEARLKNLERKSNGKFRIVSDKTDLKDAGLLEKHPTIFRTKDGNPLAVWLEHYHPLNAKVAFNVEIMGQIAINSIPEAESAFIEYADLLDRIDDKIAA